MQFEGSTTKYPDIVIRSDSGTIKNLIDVKTDLGWNRNGMYSFCKEWEKRIESIKGTKTVFKQGDTKALNYGVFSKRLKYHIVVVTKNNSGKIIDTDYEKVKKQFKNIRLYVLSEGVHPNNYKYTLADTMEKLVIHYNEFKRLFTYVNK